GERPHQHDPARARANGRRRRDDDRRADDPRGRAQALDVQEPRRPPHRARGRGCRQRDARRVDRTRLASRDGLVPALRRRPGRARKWERVLIRVVAIDGPAGSGKSTVARGVADALGLEVLDTGAMYRAVTLLALEAGFDLGDGEAITGAAEGARLELGDPPGSVRVDGREVSREIRGPAVSAAVSQV